MKRRRILTLITVALLATVTFAEKEPPACKVVLLPLEQGAVRPAARISEKRFQEMAAVQFSRLEDVTLLKHQALTRLVDEALIDDAVFELIVTDSLTGTLARLDRLESTTAQALEQRRVAHGRGIRYMVRISITPIRRQWHIAYGIMDTKTGGLAHARSFYEVDNRPNVVANEIAKHVVRGLWKVVHNGQ